MSGGCARPEVGEFCTLKATRVHHARDAPLRGADYYLVQLHPLDVGYRQHQSVESSPVLVTK